MSLYVIASSDKSKNYYPYNQPYHFKSFIKQPLELERHWRVELTEIDFDEKKSQYILFMLSVTYVRERL